MRSHLTGDFYDRYIIKCDAQLRLDRPEVFPGLFAAVNAGPEREKRRLSFKSRQWHAPDLNLQGQ